MISVQTCQTVMNILKSCLTDPDHSTYELEGEDGRFERHVTMKEAADDRNLVFVVRHFASGQTKKAVQRDMNILTLEEAQANKHACIKAMRDELQRWVDLRR